MAPAQGWHAQIVVWLTIHCEDMFSGTSRASAGKGLGVNLARLNSLPVTHYLPGLFAFSPRLKIDVRFSKANNNFTYSSASRPGWQLVSKGDPPGRTVMNMYISLSIYIYIYVIYHVMLCYVMLYYTVWYDMIYDIIGSDIVRRDSTLPRAGAPTAEYRLEPTTPTTKVSNDPSTKNYMSIAPRLASLP